MAERGMSGEGKRRKTRAAVTAIAAFVGSMIGNMLVASLFILAAMQIEWVADMRSALFGACVIASGEAIRDAKREWTARMTASDIGMEDE